MNTLRQFKGLAGFPKTSESEYDAFNTGHSSTSISVALGMARARDLKGENFNVVAVIGDGSISNGMSLEAINDSSQMMRHFFFDKQHSMDVVWHDAKLDNSHFRVVCWYV